MVKPDDDAFEVRAKVKVIVEYSVSANQVVVKSWLTDGQHYVIG